MKLLNPSIAQSWREEQTGISDVPAGHRGGSISVGTSHVTITPTHLPKVQEVSAPSQKVSPSSPLCLPEPAQMNPRDSRAFPGLAEEGA